MTTGDPINRCGLCGQSYYVANGHACTGASLWGQGNSGGYCSTCDGTYWGPHFCPGPRREPVVYKTNGTTTWFTIPSPGWECPRCHKIHAYWVPSCDCQPEKPKCPLCGRAEGETV